VAEKPERAVWWAKMETLVQTSNQTFGNGARFRKDRPSYAEMQKYVDKQVDMFDDESIDCYCGE
jgi:hypothetical protein